MEIQQMRLDSYFSLPTDLASEMSDWPEFVTGQEYNVQLQTQAERVTVRLVPQADDDRAHVIVRGEGSGSLFVRVLGYVVYAMAAHSDDVAVMRWRDEEV